MTPESLIGVAVFVIIFIFILAVVAQKGKNSNTVGGELLYGLFKIAVPLLAPIIAFALIFIFFALGMRD